ncbi:hypothetical protein [Phytohabitans suffuscus]|uniref:Uncharacterized protein n=1 Tax=Phytohabitans suffuscus TaxID=624315 RepID=A0A6F8YAH8_9ACTN|nr:hypothetical protein [Phytohabitans suffuscus]BCB82988.1 hypothetical protein Psuf_003010 [Phytohabitans suffuscus]
MRDFSGRRRARAAKLTKRVGAAVALVVAVGLVGADPAAASQQPPAGAVTQLDPAAAGEVMVRWCTGWPDTNYYWLEGGYPNPNGCQRCYEKGLAYEATGTYYAWCSKEVNGAILWLSCRICLAGDKPAVTPARLPDARPVG